MDRSHPLDRFREQWRPTVSTPPAEWVDGRVAIQDGLTPRYQIELVPWMREPLNAFGDNDAKEVVVVAPIGTGKTAMLEAALQYIIGVDAGPTLLVGQTDDDLEEWAVTRLRHSIENTADTLALLPPRNRFGKTRILFAHMPLFMTGANLSGLQEKSMRRVLCDEVWRYRPGMLNEARSRLHDRWNRQLFMLSQAGVEGDDLDRAWSDTDQKEFSFACPVCGTMQPFRWSAVEFDLPADEEEFDMLRVAGSARMRCQNPDCDWQVGDEANKRRQLAQSAVYVATSQGLPGRVGFHYNALANWRKPLSELVIDWLKAQKALRSGDHDPLRQFIQKRLAEPWRPNNTDAREELLGAGYRMAEYSDGKPWDDEAHRFMTVDKQRDHYWCVIRAWRANSESRLLWCGRADTWEELEQLRCRYRVRDTLTFIDCGFATDEVYHQCARRNWTAMRGTGKNSFRHVLRGNRAVDRAFSPFGSAQVGAGLRARYVFWCVDRAKDILDSLRNGRGAAWEIPDDVPRYYLDQIDSEVKREVVSQVTKQIELRWVRAKRANHLWDCEAMQVAAALMLTLFGQQETRFDRFH